jgi:hypothetical protein
VTPPAGELDQYSEGIVAVEDPACPGWVRAAVASGADEPECEVTRVDTRSWREEGACYSDDRRYRWPYSWPIGVVPTIVWVGLNPGTGDREGRYRPTLQRMVDRSVAEGMGRFTLVNLFAWRATKPSALKAEVRAGTDIIGKQCDEAIRRAVASTDVIVVAWGAHGSLLGRDRAVAPLLENPLCLGTTSTGQPRHPLYVSAATSLVPWRC